MHENPGDEGDSGSRRKALMGLVVIAVLAILALLLVRELGRESQREDCLMMHRRDCAAIELPPHG
jgi:hypothetical protein